MNPSKRKGTAWESECARYLGTRRLPLAGPKDIGDLDDAAWVIECKAEKSISIAQYMNEVGVEVVNSGKPYGVALVKRRMRNTADGYAVMTIATWKRVRDELEGAGTIHPAKGTRDPRPQLN